MSPRRAFVLQFHPEADVAEGLFLGRAEHVVSGRSVRFASLDDLLMLLGLMFLGRLLAEANTDEE